VLAQLDPGEQDSILVTSASRNDGKTSVAVGLALVAASAGHRVVLLDFDLRRPGIGQVLEVPEDERHSIRALGTGEPLAELLAENSRVPLLKVLALRDDAEALAAFEKLLRWLPHRLGEARELGDLVIVDAPPLGEVSDALRIADDVEDLLVVIRPGRTELGAFRSMRDLLGRLNRPATGFVLIGDAGRTIGYTVSEPGPSEYAHARTE
jgi:Mrp family chromosome partitioning ATPase